MSTAPNEIIKPVRAKAMQVPLTTDQFDTWLTAPTKLALGLQRPLPCERMQVIATGERKDQAAEMRGRVMATGDDLRRAALALQGTTESPHFDRVAFKVARTYVTLASDRLTANFKFSPDEQEFKCLLAPDVFSAVPNAWGKRGWTTGLLSAMSEEELVSALKTAWVHALPKGRIRHAE